MSNSGGCLNSGEMFSGEFPTFQLLVVNDDTIYVKILEQMLNKCQYEATTCDRAEIALSLLRENKECFHLVMSDVRMPDMDGFELLGQIALEMDLTVIMMSTDDSRSVVLKGVVRGAHDYVIKPVSIDALKNIWQHIVHKDEWKSKIFDQSGKVEQQKEVVHSRVANEGRSKSSKRRTEERSDTDTSKKARTVWSQELHEKFVQAIDHLGIDRAVPKKILELMNVPRLTREHIASHLQKHRLQLRKHQSMNNSFMGHSEATTGILSNHLQALAPNGQLPLADQIHHFSFQNPMLRYQSEQQVNNMFYGIPTHNPSLLGMNMLSDSNSFLSWNGSSTAVDFSLNQNIALAGCSFAKSVDAATAEADNIFNELYQQNVGSTFDASYLYSINNGMEQSGQNVNASIAEIGYGPHINDEGYPGSSYQTAIFREPFGHEEDLVSSRVEDEL